MLPKLSDRAASRCTANILRAYPAWKQAKLRSEGGESLEAMLEFINRNTAYLSELQAQISEGFTPCIDRGWPGMDAPTQPEPEPLIKEVEVIKEVPVEVEKIVEVEVERVVERPVEKAVYVKDPETIERLNDTERKLKAAQEALDAARSGETQPAKVFDLDKVEPELLQEAEAHDDKQAWLWAKLNDLGNLMQMNHPDAGLFAEKHSRLHGALYKPSAGPVEIT